MQERLFQTGVVTRNLVVQAPDAGKRLDQFLVEQLENVSRARVQQLLGAGRVRMDGAAVKASYRMRGGEAVSVEWEPPRPLRAFLENIPLDVLYEDDDLVVVNKPQ